MDHGLELALIEGGLLLQALYDMKVWGLGLEVALGKENDL